MRMEVSPSRIFEAFGFDNITHIKINGVKHPVEPGDIWCIVGTKEED